MWRLAGIAALLSAAASLPPAAPAGEMADAAENLNRAALARLVAAGAEVDAAQADGMTALLWAAYHDDSEAVQLLLEAGASVTAANHYGVTALALACQNGNAEMVERLLDRGADPKAQLRGGETVLMTAARTGRVDCVKALAERGAEIDAQERRGQTALMWAAADGHAEVVDYLLAKGAEFRTPLKSGFTPLLFAVRQGHAGVVRSLLKAGAPVNEAARPERPNGKRMRSGTAPLMLAVENGHFELALELVRAGADVNDQRSGFTPLHAMSWVRKAVRGDGDDGIPPPAGSGKIGGLQFVRALVESGAEVDARIEHGRGGGGQVHTEGATPFLLAAQTADLPLLKLLVELGADPAIPNVEGCVPILTAAGVGVTAPGEEAGKLEEAIETVVYLLELGADINAVDKRGETVMHGAAYKCSPEMIKLLDTHGADIAVWNRKNKSGWTPLMIAQGFRQGNFRPIAEMIAAVSKTMEAHGLTPPPAPERRR